MSCFEFESGWGRSGFVEACGPQIDVFCDKCGIANIQLLSTDGSAGEYGSVAICLPCIKDMFDALAVETQIAKHT